MTAQPQGKEADVVIFSCVRAKASGRGTSIGFLADIRRMNVALTRARFDPACAPALQAFTPSNVAPATV